MLVLASLTRKIQHFTAWSGMATGFRRGRELLRRATGANGFQALSISEELAQSVALGDVQHLCVFHLAQ